ncbi:ATP-dependent DNA helicase RecG [Clostridium botulinum]|uniref:ATP-dependent DNA helicase RecG n=1 Tax=Clostridium botulinum (strain Okra / Type B1) TaxID=498213 RepID=B1IIK6_CLOBK|nr:ATP-dependent DNA helicase RecG [Clostridium botulinum]EKX78943.1 ATP-dependent DNA helicase RecG [Clostridium botulinum CFSAN001628]ACA45331.1 ATP-dependent DNA helicase RecG [Clostridium botulinum B1 str. Okra]MBD5564489.1 ATP-dependent DNA helicase RecG [Clostridium botulinum]MBD5566866.1 ATP-dependent DNA helicase RecG [Clostridium botulinum]MBD5570521.1 ATP-dependent DNA helicase RecG [Clostridium botulinum]
MNVYSPITTLKGVGPKTKEQLEKCMIFNIMDLLLYFPRDYEFIDNYSKDKLLSKKVIIKVQVENIKRDIRTRTGKILTTIIFNDGEKAIVGSWFNQPYIKNYFKIGEEYVLQGSLKEYRGNLTINNAQILKNKCAEEVEERKIIPKYPLKGDLKNNLLIKLVDSVLTNIDIGENLPIWLIEKYKFLSLDKSIRTIHKPENQKELEESIRRLKFQELLAYCLKIAFLKEYLETATEGISFIVSEEINNLIEVLPFKLTNAQNKVLQEIFKDQEKEKPMNRLLQGDVGSGKTIIALISLFNVIKNGYQGVMLAPTEILAVQHYEEALKLFKDFNLNIELLIGSIKVSSKKEIKEKLKEGKIDLIIGTHALIEDDVEFYNLGMVITDEQHRFGVMQRSKMLNKGKSVDTLVMSATPIPRSLTLSLYGDLDLSIIDELPPGRQKIDTYYVNDSYRKRVYNFALKEINNGRQVYIVCPLVEEKEELNLNSVEKLYNDLKGEYFKEVEIAILHGKMKGKEKDTIMKDFKEGKIKALISTTVIEVGVNVPNATLMVIENAERFGLAQLHQLRGRVGRGKHKSYCILIARVKNDIIRKRMEIMKSSNDGFLVAEEDLKLRGGGEIFGFKQHGSSNLLLADVIEDIHLLRIANMESKKIIDSNNEEDNKIKEEVKIKIKNNSKFICFN